MYGLVNKAVQGSAILFSGQPSVGSLAMAPSAGRIHRLLLKPCAPHHVATAVREALDERARRLRAVRLETLARRMAGVLLRQGAEELGLGDAWMRAVECILPTDRARAARGRPAGEQPTATITDALEAPG